MVGEGDCQKRAREDDQFELEFDLPDMKRLRDEILVFLDDPDPNPDLEGHQDLDSLMRSFEQEIIWVGPSSESAPVPAPTPETDVASASGEFRPELGFLLEASDDQLGLPPPATTVVATVVEGGVTIDEGAELVRDELSNSGIEEKQIVGGDCEFVSNDAQLEMSGSGFDPFGCGDYPWWSETLPAQ